MSYQNVQDDLIVIEKEEREETGLKLWKVIMCVVVVGTLGVLGLSYSSNGFKSQISSVLSFKSSSYSLTDRLEMAYSGSIMYTELSSSEKKSLFEVFKDKYSKQVRYLFFYRPLFFLIFSNKNSFYFYSTKRRKKTTNTRTSNPFWS